MDKKTSLEQIINTAFRYWLSVIRYNIVFSLIYFTLLIIMTYGLANYLGVWDKFVELGNIKNINAYLKQLEILTKSEDIIQFSFLMIFCYALIFPLHIGFFKIFNKIDNNENPNILDLLEGYVGLNFIKYTAYFIMWKIIYNFMSSLIIPAPFWVMITLVVTPIMYFKNEPLGTAIVSNLKLVKNNFITIFACVMASAIISYFGLFLFLLGYLLTFPFWNAMIYTIYKLLLTDNQSSN